MTIRTRLTALYFVVLAASLSIFVWIGDVGFRRSIEVTVNEASSVNLQSLQRLVELSAPKGDAEVQKQLEELAGWWPSGAVFEVADANQNWIFRSPQFLLATELPVTAGRAPTFLTANLNHIQYRIASQQFQTSGQTYEIHAAVPTEPFDRALDHFRDIERETVPLLVVLASLLGYWLSGRSLAPVKRIINTAERIGVDSLSQRLEVPRPRDELRRLTEALNAMLERIDASFKRITQFTADASHDLRTPVTVIRTVAEVTLRKPRTREQYTEALAKILRTSEETTSLLENLLTLARADAGAMGMELRVIDLDIHIRKAQERAILLAASKSLDINLRTPGTPVWVRADSIAVDRLLLILLDNAIKYTAEGGFCEIELLPGPLQIQILVRDSGIGIAEHELSLIFERSYRTNRARSRESAGAGLGLAIARWITEMHGGTITAESQIGTGSLFRVCLPTPQVTGIRATDAAPVAATI
ncbi:MAG TPA: ATP-binding protein [Candidatus Acidoferrum sp.]|nr:ATP-binding protein [Candidatus Acidoferrum sp.]